MRVGSLLTAGAVAAFVLAAAVAGCDGITGSEARIVGHRLTIYASLPEEGPWSAEALQVRRGAELALDEIHGAVGRYRIAFVVLDDSTARAGTSVPGLIATNAQRAGADRTTIGYLGELNPGASAISIPVLNRAGIPQVSPTDGAIGLTTATPGAFPGEPEKYYPTGKRTFARVVPSDAVEARAQVRLQRSLGCARTYVLDDETVYGADLAGVFQHAARREGLKVIATYGYDPTATSYAALADIVAATHAGCVFLAALAESHAAAVTKAVAAALPEARIFASDGVADGAFLNPAQGGIPSALDARVYLTIAPLAPSSYPLPSRRFFTAYQRHFGTAGHYSIYGYAAMTLLLRAIDEATDHGHRVAVRSRVVHAIFATRDRHSVLGTYGIDPQGDITLDRYGAYRVANGKLRFLRAIGTN